MKSNDKVLIKNESEDSFYGYYYDNSNIVFIPNEFGSEITVSKNLESSNDLDAQSRPSTIQLSVIEAETEKRDIFPGKKLNASHSGSDFELIDISEALLPYLLPVEPRAETDSKNIIESVHTNSKQPEHAQESSSDSAEVDVTTDDNDYPTLFREECEQQVNRQGGRDCQTLKGTVAQCSAKKEVRSSLPAQSSAKRKGCAAKNRESRIVKQKRSRKEEIGKSISSETYVCPDGSQQMYIAPDYNGVQSPILSTGSRTSEGRMLCRVESTSTSASSSICSSPELDPMDEKNWDMFLSRKYRIKQNGLMDDIQICKTRYSDNPEGVHQKRDENKEMGKDISADTFNDTQSLISCTNNRTSEGRTLWSMDSNPTSAPSSIFSTSELDLMDERNWDTFLSSKCRIKQNELMDGIQIFKTRYSNNPEGVHQKEDGNEEIVKSISAEISNSAQSLIPSTSSGASEGRKLCRVDSNSISAFSSICSNSELDPVDKREGLKFLDKSSREKQKELMDDLRITVRDIPRGIQKEMDIEEEISNFRSAEIDSGIESPIPSISSETSSGRNRKLCYEEDISSFSTSHNSSEVVTKLDQKTKNRIAKRKYRKKQKNLMEKLRHLTPGVLHYPKMQKDTILIFARDYIDILKRSLKTKRKRIKDLKKENKSLLQEFHNLIEDQDNTLISRFR